MRVVPRVMLVVRMVVVRMRVGVAVVLVDMGMNEPRLASRHVGHDLEPTLLYATCGEHPLRRSLQHVGRPAHHDDLEAMVVVEVHVHRGAYGVPEPVLDLREPLGEVAHVMVVDQREGRHGGLSLANLLLRDLRTDQVPKDLRAGRPACLDDGVELRKERIFHGDAEPHEHVFHRAAHLSWKAGPFSQ